MFWKWWESVLPQKVAAPQMGQIRASGELLMLVTALDEFRQGRFLEVGDILSSRIRALGYFAERGKWKIAREFLTYAEEPHSLVSNATEDAAARLVERKERREKKLAREGGR